MYKYFLKPLGVVIGIYFVTALGIASDIAQLTNINLLDFMKNHSPISYYILIGGTLMLYLLLVIIEYIRNNTAQLTPKPHSKSGQFVTTRNVKYSNIIQIMKNKED